MAILPIRRSADRRAGAPDMRATGTSLADLPAGIPGRITGVDSGIEPGTARRLADLGFAPGREVTVLRRAPLGDPAVILVADYDIALRREQTRCIFVDPVV